MDLITYSIPFFFLLMGVELVVGRLKGKHIYRGPDVTADLALGVLQVVFTVVASTLLSFMYLKAYEYRIVTLPEGNVWVWILAFVGVDFCYYWFHRSSHRVMLAWATHAPHHSSEDYNLAVALRQGPIQPLCSRFFYLPLAFAGIPYGMFAVMVSVNTLYQFWIHTELIGKMGPLEYIFNTPSHHRVHHGCNGKYLDKNHAGIFIIWDKLFGSFVEEADTPVYGTVKAAQTWNPIVASWLPFADMAMKWSASTTIADKLRSVFAPPEWLPPGVIAAAAVDGPRAKWDQRPDRHVSRYVAVMFVQVLLASVAYIVAAGTLSFETSVVVAAWLTLSYGSLGALLDGRAWAIPAEIARFVVGVPVVVAALLL
ncbi:MAG: sterol desaturase family protein [Deltaproteobacteria bacterium]|nr:sterol desaturase family protein [Deltaproteobacteria bacterium]